MTNSKLGEPCFYVVGRTENTRLVMVPVSSPIFLSLYIPPLSHPCCSLLILEKVPIIIFSNLQQWLSNCGACTASGT